MSSSQMMSDFEKQPEKINLKEIWYKVLSNWTLLLAIFAIVITSTYLYLRYTTPMYEASVKIIIKDDENTTSGLSETSAFEDLKIMQFNNCSRQYSTIAQTVFKIKIGNFSLIPFYKINWGFSLQHIERIS